MKFKYYFLLSLKSFLRKKVNIIVILLFVISMTMTIFVSSFSKTFATLIDNQVNGNINYKILLINDPENKLNLKGVNNIDYVTEFNSYNHYVNTEKDYSINLIGVPKNYIDVLYGEKLKYDNDKSMICPSRFYLGNNPEVYDDLFLNNINVGKDFLNQSMILKSANYEEEYNIIGIYDVNKYTYGEYNTCFTSEKNIKEIFDNEIELYKQECDSETHDCENIGYSTTSIVVVKDVKEIENTQKQIEELGYAVRRFNAIDSEGISFITGILHIISIIIMIITFVILLISNNKFVLYNKKNNLIYKSLGYDDKILIRINYIESLIIAIFSFIITIIFVISLYCIFSNILSVEIKTGCQLYISYRSIIIAFLVTMVVALLSTYISLKNNKNSIIEELSDGEL